MSIDKLKNKFFTGAWLPDSKHYLKKINELIDRINGVGIAGDGSYKKYSVVLSQSSTSAPTIDYINSNTIGTIVWTRSDQGIYYGTLTGAFPVLKTVLFYPCDTQGSTDFKFYFIRQSDDIIVLTTLYSGVPTDDYLVNQPIELIVYN